MLRQERRKNDVLRRISWFIASGKDLECARKLFVVILQSNLELTSPRDVTTASTRSGLVEGRRGGLSKYGTSSVVDISQSQRSD